MNPIIRFLKRDGAKNTWLYERRVILPVEAICLLVGIWAAPDTRARVWLAITLPLALLAAELTRASRSGATRKAELAAARGHGVVLPCEADLVRAARNLQLITATAPIVALGATVANAGLAGLTRAAIAAFVVSVIRYAMVEGYGHWRAWYRARVPVVAESTPLQELQWRLEESQEELQNAKEMLECSIKANARHRQLIDSLRTAMDRTPCAKCRVKLGDVRGEEPTAVQAMDGQWYCANCYDDGAGVRVEPTTELLTTKPFDSGQMARAIEQALTSKE